ncbi:MAG TPA: serine O-acetyltransferase [Candidatus Hydrogenedentes bacterium]|jgi:serine O-acetyltransferase|nr:MAG: Serine acetyltransferase [Candidatus Hydrogenedentes bacterium ADurb.Bin170]HNZ49036.1 serine O-acetyltransferase [Candidatus Hydrogenedentota bacterium]HOD94637.1 serine O-acetyltransferase [Candidatus Hydrogenedentota bacterium]HOH43683.1 serine O-acetyltransferase [Candidatus Hydrogenedentota bacterium]HOM49302.1 serine O-acetyltransferase [Candidatus Hydrogenedentota bacterium]
MESDKRDRLWDLIREETAEGAWREPMLSSFLYSSILNHKSFEAALGFQLASKLESVTLPALTLRDLIEEAFDAEPRLAEYARADLLAVHERDPACRKYSQPLLYFKGYLSIQAQRVANHYWHQDRMHLALFLQSRISDIFGVDIHPAASLGKGCFIDHATGVVIGETAVVEENVSMLHGVTLGGTGKERGDRHPKIRKGVLISTGARILGNIEVGEGAKVAACAVVLENVPPHTTVAGIPARPVGATSYAQPSLEMDHKFKEAESTVR